MLHGLMAAHMYVHGVMADHMYVAQADGGSYVCCMG